MQELKPIKEGKVREIYDNGDSLIMVATDRISCFDVRSNQNLDIWVRTVPFFVTSLFRMTSKQLIRSVATMIRLSPLS